VSKETRRIHHCQEMMMKLMDMGFKDGFNRQGFSAGG
jgi:Fe2+ transport system protein FeoA